MTDLQIEDKDAKIRALEEQVSVLSGQLNELNADIEELRSGVYEKEELAGLRRLLQMERNLHIGSEGRTEGLKDAIRIMAYAMGDQS